MSGIWLASLLATPNGTQWLEKCYIKSSLVNAQHLNKALKRILVLRNSLTCKIGTKDLGCTKGAYQQWCPVRVLWTFGTPRQPLASTLHYALPTRLATPLTTMADMFQSTSATESAFIYIPHIVVPYMPCSL